MIDYKSKSEMKRVERLKAGEPREWWINTFSRVVFEHEPGLALKMDPEIVRVVEAKAYDALKAELDKAKSLDLTTAVLAKDIELAAELERARAAAKSNLEYIGQFKLELAEARAEIEALCLASRTCLVCGTQIFGWEKSSNSKALEGEK